MNDFIPSIKVTLYLSADKFDFDQVTRRIGVTPTVTRKKEDFPPQSIVAGVAYDIWALEIKEENCIAISILFKKLFAILKDKEQVIKNICGDYGIKAGFEVVIHMKDGDSPEVVLPREVVAFAAAINAEIGFDIYCYE